MGKQTSTDFCLLDFKSRNYRKLFFTNYGTNFGWILQTNHFKKCHELRHLLIAFIRPLRSLRKYVISSVLRKDKCMSGFFVLL